MTLLRRAALTTRRHIITPVGPIDPNAIIMSPSGNDSNSGTLASPVKTLAQAQTLCRANGLSKTVYLRGGTYTVTTGLLLSASDNGETWTFYPPDGYNSPILDFGTVSLTAPLTNNSGLGASSYTACCVFISGGNNIIINGLQFQNFPAIAILIEGGSTSFPFPSSGNSTNITLKNNVFLNGNGGGPPFNTGDGQNANGLYSSEAPAIWALGNNVTSNTTDLNNILITNNVIMNMMTAGITFQHSNGANNVISNNYFQSTMIAGQDTGAIYSQFTTGLQILYNYIRDGVALDNPYSHLPGGSLPGSAAIYGDQNTINWTATGNVIAGSRTNSSTYPYFGFYQGFGNSGAQNNGNIFDMGAGLGQYALLNHAADGTCVFKNNIIISKFAGTGSGLFVYSTPGQNYCTNGQTFTNGPNGYNNYGGGSVYTTSIAGTSPIVPDSNPQTANPQLSGWTYNLAPTSPFLSSPVSFPAQPANWGTPGFWGPPGFVIPQSSTLPSGITSPSSI